VAAAAEGGLVMAPGSPLEAAVRMAAVAALRDCPVFLHGESGSGKELMARFLHLRSSRRSGPFVAVNCGAISPQLIESELFGHRKGAFTGALEDSPGRFRLAAGGTLFLDEVGDMPLDVQTRLLRALQEKAVCPVGGRSEFPVDFRLVCATHRDLRAAVDGGRFREDLYYRIAVVEVRLPPLRERPADIPLLLRRFLEEVIGPGEARRAMGALPDCLLGKPWPGNVRELRNLAERYAVLREMGGGWEEAAEVTGMLPQAAFAGVEPSGAVPAAGAERRVRNSRVTDAEILQALASCGYHRTRASLRLGITRRALQYRLARLAPPE
jgi:two-component system response regulator PilR (NtrC family)